MAAPGLVDGNTTALHCATCGRSTTLDFVRTGHYPQTLLTAWGWLHLAVPRVECACNSSSSIPFGCLNAYDRLESDLDALTLQCIALAVSPLSVHALIQLQSGQTVSIGTVYRPMARVFVLAVSQVRQKLTISPPGIILDALWGTVMGDTGRRKRTRRAGCAR